MNKFLKQHGVNGNQTILNEVLDLFMEKCGFELDTCAYGDNTIGWSTAFYDKDKYYFYRVHITDEFIQIHEEYNFGGLSGEWKYVLGEEHLESEKTFISKLNEAYEPLNI